MLLNYSNFLLRLVQFNQKVFNSTLIRLKFNQKSLNKKMFLFKPVNCSENTYDPAKSNYHLTDDAIWNENENVPFLALAKTFAAIENVSGRLKSIEIMSNYLSSVMALSPNGLVKSIYLCLNKVTPDYEGVELGKFELNFYCYFMY